MRLSAIPSLDQAFSKADELRNFMRALRAIYDSAPDTLGAFESTSPAQPPILLEQALEGLYAGEANRFINFYGPPGTITTVPYHAVILGGDPNVSEEALDFTDKVVFVGYSDQYDPGQPDRFYTVFTREDGVDLSGVEIAATGFANLLTNRSLSPVDGWTAIAMLTAFGLVIGLVVYAMPAYAGVPVAFVLAAAYGFAAQQAFNESAVLMPVATPLLVQAPLALFIGLLGQYLLERRRGQRISDAINYYLPDDIARDLAQDRFDAAKINKVVYSTCFATDMAGFSTVSEQLPPGELAVYLNDYFETLAAPLKKHGVHVTEFRADAIMCAWTADESSARTAAQGDSGGTGGRRCDQGFQETACDGGGAPARRPGGGLGLRRPFGRRRALRLQHRRRLGQYRVACRGPEQARRHPDPGDR